MKKLVLVLVLLFVSVVSNAQILEKSASGKYRISTEKYLSLGIIVKPEAQKYDSLFSKAILNPDRKILAEKTEDFLKLKLLFKEKVEVKENFIVYNSQTKIIDYSEVITEKEETTYLILFCVMSLILMATSDVLYKKSRIALIAAVATSIASFVAVVVASFVAVAATIFFAFLFAVALAAFAAAAVHAEDYKFYKILSIIFYISITTGMVLLFI